MHIVFRIHRQGSAATPKQRCWNEVVVSLPFFPLPPSGGKDDPVLYIEAKHSQTSVEKTSSLGIVFNGQFQILIKIKNFALTYDSDFYNFMCINSNSYS